MWSYGNIRSCQNPNLKEILSSSINCLWKRSNIYWSYFVSVGKIKHQFYAWPKPHMRHYLIYLKRKIFYTVPFPPPYTVYNGNNTPVSTNHIVQTIYLKSDFHYTDLNFVIQI